MHIWNNSSPLEIIPSGLNWVEGATRFLATKMRKDERIESICLNRKGISDDEGKALLIALRDNKTCRKLQLEGNKLGQDSLKPLQELISHNDTLQHLSLECNKLYTQGTKEEFKKFIDCLKYNDTLLSLNLS